MDLNQGWLFQFLPGQVATGEWNRQSCGSRVCVPAATAGNIMTIMNMVTVVRGAAYGVC